MTTEHDILIEQLIDSVNSGVYTIDEAMKKMFLFGFDYAMENFPVKGLILNRETIETILMIPSQHEASRQVYKYIERELKIQDENRVGLD